jgi:hypothetical protein
LTGQAKSAPRLGKLRQLPTRERRWTSPPHIDDPEPNAEVQPSPPHIDDSSPLRELVRKLWRFLQQKHRQILVLGGLAGVVVVVGGALWVYKILDPVVLTLSCGTKDGGKELEACNKVDAEWRKKSWWTVRVKVKKNQRDTDTENKSIDTRLNEYRRLLKASYEDLKAHDENIDIYQIDVNWVRDLSDWLYPLDDDEIKRQGHVDQMLQAGRRRDGKLVAVPWSANFGVLYYNNNLLRGVGNPPIPETWGDLGSISNKAQSIARKQGIDLYGFAFQGKDEGLTCNALEWLYSYYKDSEAERFYVAEKPILSQSNHSLHG